MNESHALRHGHPVALFLFFRRSNEMDAEPWKRLTAHIVDLCFGCSRLAAPVVTNESPEGFLPADASHSGQFTFHTLILFSSFSLIHFLKIYYFPQTSSVDRTFSVKSLLRYFKLPPAMWKMTQFGSFYSCVTTLSMKLEIQPPKLTR
jgi:hypothetical protein